MTADPNSRGLVIVYTGNGKGKTTAALGLCVRAVGWGNKIKIIQFIKSDWEYGELKGIARLAPDVEIDVRGAGCIGILGDDKPLDEHRAAAAAAFSAACQVVSADQYDIVILDEVSLAAHLGLIAVDDLLDLIHNRPPHLHLVLTGRYADQRVIDAADLVTEMKEIKHPFQHGQLARKGIDF